MNNRKTKQKKEAIMMNKIWNAAPTQAYMCLCLTVVVRVVVIKRSVKCIMTKRRSHYFSFLLTHMTDTTKACQIVIILLPHIRL